MKKIVTNCTTNAGAKTKFTFYIGSPKEGNHPLQNQLSWLSKNSSGLNVPQGFLDGIQTVYEKAAIFHVNPEELLISVIKKMKDCEIDVAVPSFQEQNPTENMNDNSTAEEKNIDEDYNNMSGISQNNNHQKEDYNDEQEQTNIIEDDDDNQHANNNLVFDDIEKDEIEDEENDNK